MASAPTRTIHHGRPPKPRGWEEDTNRDVSAPECRRASLKETVLKQSVALTPAEREFLDELCVTGNEIEVQVAHERLLNTDLFFRPHHSNNSCSNGVTSLHDDSETGWASDTIRMGHERDYSTRSMDDSCGALEFTSMDASFRSLGTMGSERRQSLLLERKNNTVFNLWKAHETGLALSKQASRRSVMGRRSMAVNSSSKRDLSCSPDIFRPLLLEDVKSDNSRGPRAQRRVSWSSAPAAAKGKLQQQLRPKARPEYRRMDSEGSRKSVTFSEDLPKPLREPIAERSISLPQSMTQSSLLRERAPSTGSVPSLHLSAPIGSPTSQSVASIPSLHMANSVRSDSGNSVRSDSAASDITESERFYDDNLKHEEKKSAWESSFVPAVIIPEHGQAATLQDAIKLLHANDPHAPLLLDVSDRPVRPVLMQRASTSGYQGEGIEVTDVSFEELPSMADTITLKASNSFDETRSTKRAAAGSIFRRLIRRSLSDESLGIYVGRPFIHDISNTTAPEIALLDDDSSWNLGFDDEDDYYDSWKVIEDEYVNGYGGGGTLPFRILGTSADDVDAHPHVLSPPLMESLQAFLPQAKGGDNFWMKYSMVRDGASFHAFLQQARGAKYSILAIETVEGEVFGAFTAEPWRKNWNYFGDSESFLWKMRHSRKEKCHSIIDQAQMESEIDVYPFTGANNCIQLCTHDKIAVGGGTYETSSPSSIKSKKSIVSSPSDGGGGDDDGEQQDEFKDHDWGFGLTIESDFMHGTTSPCLTFNSPSLSTEHPSGSLFEIMNLELWTLTPCYRLEDAEKLELGKLFLEKHTKV